MKFHELIADLIGQNIVAKEITSEGVTRTFHFRKLNGAEVDELQIALIGDDNKLDHGKLKGNIGREIAASLCNENGGPLATADEINALPNALRKKFHAVVSGLNGGEEKKDSPTESGSGTP